MADLVTVYLEGKDVYWYDGSTFNKATVPNELLINLTATYSTVHDWVEDTVDSITNGHGAIGVLVGNIDPSLTLTPVADFDGYFNPSIETIVEMLQGGINEYVKDNKGTVNAFSLPTGVLHPFNPKDEVLYESFSFHRTNQYSGRIVEYYNASTGVKKNVLIGEAVPYMLHKTLKRPLPPPPPPAPIPAPSP